ncbi:MAG TPA: molybdenum cofactor guanylyltransferase [Terriglobales bacterium]|nr:molybdenum cofactor guanylyltransferase [Terriglobales bacterium]
MNQSKQPARVGFVLAGGTSSRMGADKAFLEFQGQTLLERALALIGRVCPSAAIVGDPARFSSYGAVVEDVYTGCGPLAGIHAALTRSYAELNLMLAVDLPFVSEDLLSYLFSVAEETSAVVTVPRTGKGFQPLCAVYRPEFATVADRALQAAKYKIDALFGGLSLRVIEQGELEKAGFSERNFFNVNTPADRRTAEDSF